MPGSPACNRHPAPSQAQMHTLVALVWVHVMPCHPVSALCCNTTPSGPNQSAPRQSAQRVLALRHPCLLRMRHEMGIRHCSPPRPHLLPLQPRLSEVGTERDATCGKPRAAGGDASTECVTTPEWYAHSGHCGRRAGHGPRGCVLAVDVGGCHAAVQRGAGRREDRGERCHRGAGRGRDDACYLAGATPSYARSTRP